MPAIPRKCRIWFYLKTSRSRLEWSFVVRGHRGRNRALRRGGVADDEQIQNVVALHKHDLASLRGVKLAAEPVARRLGDLASGNYEDMIDENLPTDFQVKYLVADHHGYLIQDFRNVGASRPGSTRGIELSLLCL